MWKVRITLMLCKCNKNKGGKAQINEKNCRVCGRCAEICENEAITVQMTSDVVVRFIERIKNLVDVKSE